MEEMKEAIAKDEPLVGRDEMNLAEFPITLLTDKSSKTVKTIVFESKHGKLTVTGSDDLGLPTAPDADVIVALIQLTKMRNNFTDPTVQFSRYELLKLLGWDDQGRHYRRIDESLRRWVGVTLRYDKSWWDNEIKCRVDANFHIIDSVVIYDQEVRHKLRSRQQSLPLSTFSWSKTFFKSCNDDNIKKIDLTAYFSLRSAVSKRLYRLLDKRFYVRGDWTFDLRELAFEHVGLSRNYTAAKIKEKLQPALEELESIGFLQEMPKAERYENTSRGEWRVRLAHLTAPVEAKIAAEPGSLVHELTARGVTPGAAREVLKNFSEDQVRRQIEQVDFVRAKKPKKIADLGAYLVVAIREDYAAPAGFESADDRSKREAAERERQHQDQERRHREAAAKALEREAEAKVRLFWEGLTAAEQEQFEVEALSNADEATRAGCMNGPAVMKKVFLRSVREEFIRKRLDLPSAG
jgi:hypothetical protein